MKRSCGVLMPISSLPSPYGIGTLGQTARDFVDFLAKAGQSWWQILPVGHTGYGDSPYQCFSTYAGNPYFVDLDTLCEDGLLTREEVTSRFWGDDPGSVDYAAVFESRYDLLRLAARRGWERDTQKVAAFRRENPWVEEYALYMALKASFGQKPWSQWEDEGARLRDENTLARYRITLKEDVQLYIYIQYLFFLQWDALRAYAGEKGIRILGDLPIYVSMDSSDVWAEPEFFQLDKDRQPTAVAGVPPDYFSEDGQLWGNPLYNWEAMKADGFGWWIRRVGGAAKLYDAVRIDHFRGFESYWAVPYGEKTARKGEWKKGPGMDLVGVLTGWFHDMSFVAEDLGVMTPAVMELLEQSGLPGMKVLEFAFDPRGGSDYLPHKYTENCLCYPGTHDNTTLAAWVEQEAQPEELAFAKKYLGLNEEEGFCQGILRAGLGSVAGLFVAQLQDYLGLGAEGRVNTPGAAQGNWQWRLRPGLLTDTLAEKMLELALLYGRTEAAPEEEEAAQETCNPAAQSV